MVKLSDLLQTDLKVSITYECEIRDGMVLGTGDVIIGVYYHLGDAIFGIETFGFCSRCTNTGLTNIVPSTQIEYFTQVYCSGIDDVPDMRPTTLSNIEKIINKPPTVEKLQPLPALESTQFVQEIQATLDKLFILLDKDNLIHVGLESNPCLLYRDIV